ncbi:MAG: hypothetical protein OXC92_07350 [Flavobacteriaceae bacterium]|nr:hypothetical protein [Flavobacteriaceae bacterium]
MVDASITVSPFSPKSKPQKMTQGQKENRCKSRASSRKEQSRGKTRRPSYADH